MSASPECLCYLCCRLAKDVDSACAAGGYSSTNFAYGSTPYTSWLQLMRHPEVAPAVHAAMGTHSSAPAPAAAATDTCLDSIPHAQPSDSCSEAGNSSRHASSAAAAPAPAGNISTAAEVAAEPAAAQAVPPALPTAPASSSQPAQHMPPIFMVWGSSTGWLPLYAAITYGWRCQGYELLACLVEQAQQVAGRSEVQQPVEFYAADMLSSSLADVRVLMLTDQCWDAALVGMVSCKHAPAAALLCIIIFQHHHHAPHTSHAVQVPECMLLCDHQQEPHMPYCVALHVLPAGDQQAA